MLLVTIPNYQVLCRFSYALFLLAIVLLAVGLFLSRRSTGRIAGSAWGRSGFNLRSWPRWLLCWRWRDT